MTTRNVASSILRSALSFLCNFLLFFLILAFVITCSFLLFGAAVSLTEEDVRAFAPIVFVNVLFLSLLFSVADTLRRKLTVERPVQQIQHVLHRLMDGDFGARVHVPHVFNLENRFGEIADSINLLAEELAGVETLRTDFIANVSHELKTPLAVMQNYGTILQQPGLTDAQRLEYAKSITDASRRLANLISNILRLNKLENQQIFPTAEAYNLSEQLCQSLLQFEDALEKKDLEVDADIEENVMICSDAELLSLVWNNLISNAIKFTDPGGRISLKLHGEPDRITVIVADTGCGMTPDIGAHIFEKFYQGDTSHAIQGNGLGLALVKRVVDIVHGEIDVESVAGIGSTFTVRIRRI